jgi:hypothetical protein
VSSAGRAFSSFDAETALLTTSSADESADPCAL